jgi:hypothetical protein
MVKGISVSNTGWRMGTGRGACSTAARLVRFADNAGEAGDEQRGEGPRGQLEDPAADSECVPDWADGGQAAARDGGSDALGAALT